MMDPTGPQRQISAIMYGRREHFVAPTELTISAQRALRVGTAARAAARAAAPVGPMVIRVEDDQGRRRSLWEGDDVDPELWSAAVDELGDRWLSVALVDDGLDVRAETAEPLHDALVSIEVSGGPNDPDGYDAAADVLVDWLRAVGGEPGLGAGFVTVAEERSVYETYITQFLRLQPLGTVHYDVQVPGYYWAVLLQAPHIEALGGRHRVIADAPVAAVEAVGASSLLCRVVERPSELDHEALRPWREFLLPVLPPGALGGSGRDAPVDIPSGLVERPVPLEVAVAVGGWHAVCEETEWPGLEAPEVIGQRAAIMIPWRSAPDGAERDTWVAVVDAWAMIGEHGRFVDAQGQAFGSRALVEVDASGLRVEVDLGVCPPAVALRWLRMILAECAPVLGTAAADRFATIVVS